MRLRIQYFSHAYFIGDNYQRRFEICSLIYKSISTMKDRAPRLQVAWQGLKASRDNGANEFRSDFHSFHGELNAVARAHTRDAFVPRQEMSRMAERTILE